MDDKPRRKRRLMEDAPPPPDVSTPPSEPVGRKKPQTPDSQQQPKTQTPDSQQQPKTQTPTSPTHGTRPSSAQDTPPKTDDIKKPPKSPTEETQQPPSRKKSFFGGREDPPPLPDFDDMPSAPELDAQVKEGTKAVKSWMEFYGFAKPSEIGGEIDLYRDTPVRLFGYAEEVGEAFRPVIPRAVVRGTYVVTGAYILADTMDKTVRVSESQWENRKLRQREIEKVVVDTLAWQTLASVFIPGFIISRTCNTLMYFVELGGKLPTLPRTAITAAVCITLIPIIVRPIDKSVDWLLDNTLRRVLQRRPPS